MFVFLLIFLELNFQLTRSILIPSQNATIYTLMEIWEMQSVWDESDPCSWTGIDCELFNSNSNDLIISAINLEDMQITGPLPTIISSLTNLTYLDLSDNYINSSIPMEFGQLSFLSFCDLSHNYLTGSIPSTLGLISTLQDLWLNGNLLTGSIPEGLAIKTAFLEELYLNNNQLSGTIPDFFWAWPHLNQLSLAGNSLEGQLPNLFSLKKVEHLIFNNNKLSGSLPSLEQLTELKAFSAAGNKQFSGTLDQFTSLSNLKELNVSGCSFTGTIPTTFATSQFFILDVSGNSLSGTIPTTLQDLSISQCSLTGNPNLICAYTFGLCGVCHSTPCGQCNANNTANCYFFQNSTLKECVCSSGWSGRSCASKEMPVDTTVFKVAIGVLSFVAVILTGVSIWLEKKL